MVPFAEMTALLGPVKEYVREFAGMSESVAVLVTMSVTRPSDEREIGPKLGGIGGPLGIAVMLLSSNATPPCCAKARPSSDAPVFKVIDEVRAQLSR